MPSVVAKIIGDASDFEKTVGKVQGRLRGLKGAFVGFGAVLGIGKLYQWGKELVSSSSHIAQTAKKLGVTTEFLQSFTYAATQNGATMQTAELALQRFARRLGEAANGAGELLPTLRKYNIEIFNADGTARSAQDVMRDLAETIKNTRSPTERLAIAFKAFDSEGVTLLNTLSGGADKFDAWIARARELGIVIEDQTLQNMDQLQSRFDTMGIWFKTKGATALNAFLTALRDTKVGLGGGLAAVLGVDSTAEVLEAGFQKTAEFIIRQQEKIVKLRSNRKRRGGEFVDREGELIPIKDAIAQKARELRAEEERLNKLNDERIAKLQAEAAARGAAEERAGREADIQKAISDIVGATTRQMELEQLPLAERLLSINERMAELQTTINDASAPREDRLKAARDFTAELRKQKAVTDEIARARDKAADLRQRGARLRAQGVAPEDQPRGGFSFEDLLGGGIPGAKSLTRDARRYQANRERLARMKLIHGPNVENSENFQQTQKDQARIRRHLKKFGVDPDAKYNQFKDALTDVEDELEDIHDALKNL